MGYRLWTGKPPQRGTRHPGLLSLSLSSLEWVCGVGRGSKQAYLRGAPNRITWSRSVRWCLAVGLACGDQRRLMGNGSASEVLHDDALYKSTYFTLLHDHCITSSQIWKTRAASDIHTQLKTILCHSYVTGSNNDRWCWCMRKPLQYRFIC